MNRNFLTILTCLALGSASLWTLSCGGEDIGEKACMDGKDNDQDGDTDCYDSDCASRPECQGCGNGIKDGDEECDGDDFGDSFCESMGFIGGWLACNPDCTIDTSACQPPVCGDDVAHGDEECDGYDMGDHASCSELGFLGGFVSCDTETCTYDTSECFNEVVCEDVTPEPEPTGAPQCIAGYASGTYVWIYTEWVDLDDGNDYQLRLELWDTLPGGFDLTTYDLAAAPNDNYATCAACSLLVECADPNCDYWGKTYMPQAGTIELHELSEANAGALRATLRDDIEWKQVELNFETYEPPPIPAGPCHSLATPYTIDASVMQPQN